MPLFLLFLAACGTQPAVPDIAAVTDAEAAAAIAQTLCKAAEQGGITCTVEGATATVAGQAVAVGATVSNFLTLDPKTIGYGEEAEEIPGEVQITATVTLSMGAATLFSAEQSHAGTDADLVAARAAALDTWAGRWVASYGLGFVDALAGDVGAPALSAVGMAVPAQPAGQLHAWSAYPLLRGKGFDPKIADQMAPYVKSMAANLAPYVEGLSTDALHTVQVKARLGGGGAPGPCGIMPPIAMTDGATVSIVPLAGEVLVDGQPTGDICALSEPVAWPLPSGKAQLEWDQLLVLGPATVEAAPAAEEAEPEAAEPASP